MQNKKQRKNIIINRCLRNAMDEILECFELNLRKFLATVFFIKRFSFEFFKDEFLGVLKLNKKKCVREFAKRLIWNSVLLLEQLKKILRSNLKILQKLKRF